MDNITYKKCEICDNLIKIKLITQVNNKNFGKPIKIHQNKRFCSIDCQIKWQKETDWECRVGKEKAEKIRKETSARVGGDNNPSKRKEVSDKISQSLKKFLSDNPRIKEKNGMYGKSHTDNYKLLSSISKIGKRSYDDNGYKKLIERTPKGENHPNWNGGTSYLPYSIDFNKALKNKIKERDKNRCGVCNKKTQKLAVHHINYDKDDSNDKNLISLCYKCHPVTNFNRDHWILFFENKINEIYKNIEILNESNKKQ